MISISSRFSFVKNFTAGFTLVEMMVVVAIFLIITGIILLNAPQVKEKLSIELVAQELSINIRGTQVYGIATQGQINPATGQQEFPSYGIYLTLDDPTQAKTFGLASSNNLAFSEGHLAETYNIPDGYKISKLKYYSNGVWTTIETPATLVIAFKRPKPNANFLINDDPSITSDISQVGIVIQSTRDAKTKQVNVYNNGQIGVSEETP